MKETVSHEGIDVQVAGGTTPARKLTVALMPRTLPVNKFIDLFSSSIEAAGNHTQDFRWSGNGLWTTDVAILHWPDQFFLKRNLFGALKSYAKLAMLRAARLKGQRIVWVAHNVVPHDSAAIDPVLRDRFFASLDGVIFLSRRSRELVEQNYPALRAKPQLVTVHGHYRDVEKIPSAGYRPPSGLPQLGYVGLIRPYKNLEALVAAAVDAADAVTLRISGMAKEADALLDDLRARSAGAPHIAMDVRAEPLDDAEVEQAMDACHGIVLPYRNILNSGVALHALSRNRPVLAPRIGSLPELQERVGERWLQLYDGELSSDVLRKFAEGLRTLDAGATAPLDAYAWAPIGREIDSFLRHIRKA